MILVCEVPEQRMRLWTVLSHFHTAGLIGTLAVNCPPNHTAPARSALLVWKHLRAQTISVTDIPLIEPITHDTHVTEVIKIFQSFIFNTHWLINDGAVTVESLGNTLANVKTHLQSQPPNIFQCQSAACFQPCLCFHAAETHLSLSLPLIRREHDLQF